MMAKTPQQAALIEAFEEAGVVGSIVNSERLGAYRYAKVQRSGLVSELTVKVFLMQVDEQLDEWPEQGERTAQWFSPQEAASHVAEPALGKMLRWLPRVADAAGVNHPRIMAAALASVCGRQAKGSRIEPAISLWWPKPPSPAG
jgi:8-oxo-dGTP pyrophosphatase MutT (NUDIX family)